jgi:hypothetical protein
MSGHDHDHDDAPGIVYHPEDGGKPCMGCFIGAIFDSLEEDELPAVDFDPEDIADEDPQDILYARKIDASFAKAADQMAALMVQLVGEDAELLAAAFGVRLDNMITLHIAPGEGHAH